MQIKDIQYKIIIKLWKEKNNKEPGWMSSNDRLQKCMEQFVEDRHTDTQ